MRTRFAPSPTGLLHIGGLRTALYTYLLAKQGKGTFILRVEDTDQERTIDGAMKSQLQALSWAGIHPDEGVMLDGDTVVQKGDKGPYIQSERFDIYREHAQILIDSGHAYYAFDSKEELDRMREEEKAAGNPAPKYDLGVRMRMNNALTLGEEETKKKLDAGEPHVIRLKVPENMMITCTDAIRGKVEFASHTIDDAILLKSDGFPTYHLANIVDDHLMEIDTVLRGEEWLPSLPKHLLLWQAFGWKEPKYAHVPLLLNRDKSKLSKRQNDVSVQDYIDQGYLPEVIINFIALLGWNPGTTEEFFTFDELVKEFSLDRVQKAGAVFDREKLDWFQGQWIRKMSVEEFAKRIQPIVAEKHPAAADDKDFVAKAGLIHERITFFHEAPEMLSYYYSEPKVDMELICSKKQKVTQDLVKEIVPLLTETLESIDESKWNVDHLKEILFAFAEKKGYKNGQVLWPLRAILTGLPYSPGAFEVATALGKETTLKRLQGVK